MSELLKGLLSISTHADEGAWGATSGGLALKRRGPRVGVSNTAKLVGREMEKSGGFSSVGSGGGNGWVSLTSEENYWLELSEAHNGAEDSSGSSVSSLSTAAWLATGESGGVQGVSLS